MNIEAYRETALQPMLAKLDPKAFSVYDFGLSVGLDEVIASQTAIKSQQSLEGTSGDKLLRRFGNPEVVRDWQAKGGRILSLMRMVDDGPQAMVALGLLERRKPRSNEMRLPGAAMRLTVHMYESAVSSDILTAFVRTLLETTGEPDATQDVFWAKSRPGSELDTVYQQLGFASQGLLLSQRKLLRYWVR